MGEFQGQPRFTRKIDLHSFTKFRISKSWTNIPWLRRFDLGFWQTSKQFYRKLRYRENFFGNFQELPRFSKKMVLYSFTKFGIRKRWTNIPWLGRFDLGFLRTSKQFCRRLKYKENVFRKFECLLRFSRKVVFYSLTKYFIFEPCTNIQWLRRFDLDFRWKIVLYSSTKFCIFQCLRKLNHWSDCFPGKMGLYTQAKFDIFEPCTSIQLLRRLELRFWEKSNQTYRKFWF